MTSEERKAWLRSLKVGDLVASKWPGFSDDQTSVEEISALTGTVIDTVDRVNGSARSRYRRGTGRATGSSNRSELHPVTEAVMEISDRGMLQRKWTYWQYRDKLPITTVRKLLSLLTEAEREAGKENQ